MGVQHLDDVEKFKIVNDGQRPTTACDPADGKRAQSLEFVVCRIGKGSVYCLLLRLNVVSRTASPRVLDEVAGGVGSSVASNIPSTPGNSEKISV